MNIIKATDIKRTDNWRILLYGKPGLGKTSTAKYMKGNTLVLDLDGSAKVLAGIPNIEIEHFDRTHPDEEIQRILREIKDVIKDYDNLVIDNITSFQSDWFIEQGKGSKNGITNEIQDWNKWTNYFLRIITSFYDLPINIFITAWEGTQDISLESGQLITQYSPLIRKQVINELLGWTDIVGRIKVNPKTGTRGAILEGNDGVYAKNRLDLRTFCKIEDLFNFGGDENSL